VGQAAGAVQSRLGLIELDAKVLKSGRFGRRSRPLQIEQVRATNGGVDKTIRVYSSHKEMRPDEYRYWQSRPVHERLSAVAELTRAAYAMKESGRDVERIERTLVCLQRPQR